MYGAQHRIVQMAVTVRNVRRSGLSCANAISRTPSSTTDDPFSTLLCFDSDTALVLNEGHLVQVRLAV